MSDTQEVKDTSKAKAKATEKATQKEPEVIFINRSNSDEHVISLEQKGYEIRFDPKSFREVPESVLSQLSQRAQRDYFRVLGAVEAMGLTKQVEADVVGTPYNLNAYLTYQYQDAEPGWTHTRIRAADVENYKKIGYQFVRDAASIGGKVTMVEMRVNTNDYKATLHRDSRISEGLLSSKKEEFLEKVESSGKKVRAITEESELRGR